MSNVDWDALDAVFQTPLTMADSDSEEHRLRHQDILEAAGERAAIMEYDGGLSRKEAEAYVFGNILDERYGSFSH